MTINIFATKFTKALAIIGLSLATPLWAADHSSTGAGDTNRQMSLPWDASKIPLNQKNPIRPHSLIRVKIFPHLKDYKPHGRDANPQQVQLDAPKGCRQYAGKSNWAWYEGPVLATKTRFALQATTLNAPIFLRCQGAVTVHRGDANPAFSYAGMFYIRKDQKGHINVTNLVGLTQYLRGVVPSEVYAHWPLETLKTQAVAARTYAVYHLSVARKVGRRYFDVDDTVAFQAYTGLSHVSKLTDLAVSATAGQILTYDNHIIQSYYHADSGGSTENAHQVFGLDIPYCLSKKEIYSHDEATVTWQRSLSLPTIARRLRNFGLVKTVPTIAHIEIPEAGRTTSGRVKEISFIFANDAGHLILDLKTFKRLVGRPALQSTLFDVAIATTGKKQKLVINGKGFGHGVGMSQTGAAYLAGEKAWTYDRILRFYYAGVDLCSLGTQPIAAPASCYQDGTNRLDPPTRAAQSHNDHHESPES